MESYHYPKQYRQMLGYVEHHEMQILHEDGLYRHLRFKSPGTGIGYFDLITWPGSLAIRGDIGEGFIFTREADMIPWFDPRTPDGHINASYWSEKLDRGTREVRSVFNEEKFETYLKETIESFAELHGYDVASVREGVDSELYFTHVGTTDFAYQFMEGLTYDDKPLAGDLSGDVDSWLEYDHHFLLACHAILWGIKKYHASKAVAS